MRLGGGLLSGRPGKSDGLSPGSHVPAMSRAYGSHRGTEVVNMTKGRKKLEDVYFCGLRTSKGKEILGSLL